MTAQRSKTTPSLFEAIFPILALIFMLSLSVYIYGDNSSYGGNQIALIICAGIASIIGIKNGYTWKEIESGIIKGISTAMGAVLILLAVGAMIGTWIMSGLVPAMIYYGLNILSPSIFYFAACIICALSALSIGSSWTVAGTLGAALMGIATGLGLSPEVTAGAVISGAYFGDKMSPLSAFSAPIADNALPIPFCIGLFLFNNSLPLRAAVLNTAFVNPDCLPGNCVIFPV